MMPEKTINVAFDPTNGLYMIKATDLQTYSGSSIYIDGELFSNPFNTPLIIFKSEPKEIEYQSITRIVCGWIDGNKLKL